MAFILGTLNSTEKLLGIFLFVLGTGSSKKSAYYVLYVYIVEYLGA